MVTKVKQRSILSLATTFLLTLTADHAATFNIANGDVAGLIAAMQTANTNGDPSNVINLAPNGMYVLTAVADDGSGFYCCGPAGLPFVQGQLTINGNGATIQRSSAPGTPSFGILEVASQPYARNVGNLTLDGLILTGGKAGASIYGSPGAGAVSIWQSTASIRNTTITNNAETGIFDFCGPLTVTNSTISYNTSDNAYGGGGILGFTCNEGHPTVSISFSTIFENQNTSGTNAGGQFYGPGYAISDAFGIPGDIIVKNSILASPSRAFYPASACAGPPLVSLGHNIAGDASCGLTGPGDMNNTNPLLGPTTNNGGPTPTDFPAANSPAIVAVPAGYCTDVSSNPVSTDQRGFPRQCPTTIGSVEFEGLYHVCLLYDSTKATSSGATDPIKLQLCDGNGNDLSSSAITIHGTGITQVSTSITGPVQSPGNANPDSDFRFDSTLGPTGGYIFNLSTKGMATGTYNLNFTVTGDSFIYAAPFQVK
jgi:hypothetical protein